jgi:hypothetical protein
MGGQLAHPCLAYNDVIFIRAIIASLVPLLIGSLNDFLKPMPFQGPYQAEEKFPLWQLVR